MGESRLLAALSSFTCPRACSTESLYIHWRCCNFCSCEQVQVASIPQTSRLSSCMYIVHVQFTPEAAAACCPLQRRQLAGGRRQVACPPQGSGHEGRCCAVLAALQQVAQKALLRV